MLKALFFDLDDTLIDTYGTLVMDAHRQACFSMQKAGLDIPVETLFKKRLELLKSHPRGEVNALLAAHYNCTSPQVIQAGIDTYYNPTLTTLSLIKGVRPMLEKLQQRYDLYLVTSGVPKTQSKKVALLDIDALFKSFHYVAIQTEQTKQKTFQALQLEHHYQACEIAVIGDRITNEIAAGKALQYHTIWVRYGECAHILPSANEAPDHSLDDITKLPELLHQIEEN